VGIGRFSGRLQYLAFAHARVKSVTYQAAGKKLHSLGKVDDFEMNSAQQRLAEQLQARRPLNFSSSGIAATAHLL
jgi:hypothetical protein